MDHHVKTNGMSSLVISRKKLLLQNKHKDYKLFPYQPNKRKLHMLNIPYHFTKQIYDMID